MLRNSIIVLLLIVFLILGGIYGQLLTLFWAYIADLVGKYWIFIVIVCVVAWFVKDRIETRKL